MRTEYLVNLVAVGEMNLQVELWLLVAEILPGIADFTRLDLGCFLRGMPHNNRAGLERSGCAKNTVPQVVGRDDGKPHRLAPFFGQRKRMREELLFDAAKQLLGFQFVFPRSRAPQKPDVKNNNVAPAWFYAVQYIREVIKCVDIADRHKNVSRPGTYCFTSKLTFGFQIELVHFDVRRTPDARQPLRDSESDEQKN